MKIVFMGSAEFALPSLRALHESHEVVCVYSQPPRPKGRGMQVQKTPIHAEADKLGIPVRTPLELDGSEADFLQSCRAELLVVVAYGLLIPGAVLDIFPCGGVNVHPSLLPRWRGAAPIERAVMAGDSDTGVTIMKMAEALDSGNILLQESLAVAGVGAAALYESLSARGAEQLLKVIDEKKFDGMPQNESQATYAPKWKKEEALLDFNEAAEKLVNKIRGAETLGGCYFMLGDMRIKVWEAEVGDPPAPSPSPIGTVSPDWEITCGDGRKLRLRTVQKSGSNKQTITEFAKANPPPESVL